MKSILVEWPYGRLANSIFVLGFCRFAHRSGFDVRLCIPSVPLLSNDLHAIATLPLCPEIPRCIIEKNRSIETLPLDNLSPLADLGKIESFGQGPIIIRSHFQYHTRIMCETKEYLSTLRSVLLNVDSAVLKNFQILRNELSSVSYSAAHIRRGDYLTSDSNHPFMYTKPVHIASEVVRETMKFAGLGIKPIYISTDDQAYGSQWLDFEPELKTNVTRDYTLPQSSMDDVFRDLAILSNATVFIGSNSSFSVLSTLINDRGQKFFQFLPSDNKVFEFNPLDRPILYNARALRNL